MTNITRLDDQQCQALSGGTGVFPIYQHKGHRPSRPSFHVSTKHVSKASTNLAQGSAVTNTALGLGLIGLAEAGSSQANGATVFTLAS